MRCRVVAVHLGYHGVAILGIMQQCVIAMFRRYSGGIDAYALVVGGTHNYLFTPIAKDVALETGGSLGVVIGKYTREGFNFPLAIFINPPLLLLSL